MNKWIISLIIISNFTYGQKQNSEAVDLLKIKLQKTAVDTIKINILNEIAATYKYSNPKEGLKYAKEALLIAEKSVWKKGMAQANDNLGVCYQNASNYSEALIHLQKAVQLYQQLSKQTELAATFKNIAFLYSSQKKYPEALLYFEKALQINQLNNNKLATIYSLNDVADIYFKQKNFAMALKYFKQSLQKNLEIKDNNGLAYCYTRIGEIYSKQKQYSKAVSYWSIALTKYDKNQTDNIDNTLNQLSGTYLLMANQDSTNKNKYIALSKKTLEKSSSKQKKYSQSTDALKEALEKATSDTTKINILNRLSSSYFYTNPNIGNHYGERALKLAQKINWKQGIALAYHHLGVCEWVLTDYSEAINYFYLSLAAYEELKDLNGISEAFNNLGLLNVEMKKYNQAFKYFNKAYGINMKTGNKISMVYNLNNIASAYYNQKKYTQALIYYTKSENLNQSMFDANGLAYCYSQIGKIYSDQHQYEKSLKYFQKALNNYDKGQRYNLGNNYIEMGITYYKMALENPKNKKQLLAQSVQSLNNAVDLFSQAGLLERLSTCFYQLYKAKKEQTNLAESLNYFEKHIAIKDSLFSTENQNKLANLQAQREIEVRDKQIELQNLKIKSDSRKVYLLVTIAVTVLLLFIVFLWLYLLKRNMTTLLLEKNKEISNINSQKDKFFSIIAHDLRGPFNGFLGMTELLATDYDDMDKEEIEFAAVNMRDSANNLKRLLDNLLEWSRMEQGLIPFSPQENNFDNSIKECLQALKATADKKEITIETNVPQNLHVFADHNILQTILRNILSNALKFTPRNGTVKIEAQQDSKNTTISIADTGIGMDAKMIKNIFQSDVKTNRLGTENEPSTGLGMILCKEFIEKHNGKIWIESEVDKGSMFYLTFPHATE